MSRRIRSTRGMGLGEADDEWKLPTPIDPQQFGDDGDGDKKPRFAPPSSAATTSIRQPPSKPKAPPVTFQPQQQQQQQQHRSPSYRILRLTGDSLTMDQDGLLKPAAAIQ